MSFSSRSSALSSRRPNFFKPQPEKDHDYRFSMMRAQKTGSPNDEIYALQKQKNKLLDEREQLMIRISKLESQAKYGDGTHLNPQIISQLEQESKSIVSTILQQRKEIEKLRSSDNAAMRQEISEEIKMVYLENSRMQDICNQKQEELAELQKQYDELMENEGSKAIENQKNLLMQYKEKLEKCKQANHKLTLKIKNMRANKAFSDEEGKQAIKEKANELKEQIKEAKSKAEASQAKIDRSIEEHRITMRNMRIEALTSKE